MCLSPPLPKSNKGTSAPTSTQSPTRFSKISWSFGRSITTEASWLFAFAGEYLACSLAPTRIEKIVPVAAPSWGLGQRIRKHFTRSYTLCVVKKIAYLWCRDVPRQSAWNVWRKSVVRSCEIHLVALHRKKCGHTGPTRRAHKSKVANHLFDTPSFRPFMRSPIIVDLQRAQPYIGDHSDCRGLASED